MKRQTKTKARHKAKPGRKEYDNTNRGALFKNDRKEKENDPDYTGVGNLNGVECFINAWIVPKEERSAKSPVLRLSLKEKGDRAQPPTSGRKQAPAAKPGAGAGDFDDDIPF